MHYALGKSVFISYRGKYFGDAAFLAEYLRRERMCKQIVLFPPNTLCAPNEVLMPYEYVEIMGEMRNMMSSCDTFVYLNTDDYEGSYFTQTELLQWRLYKTPVIYGATRIDGEKFIIQQPITLAVPSNNEKSLWAGIVIDIDRSRRSHLTPGFSGGKYNRNCYLVACEGCGRYFLISKKLMSSVLKNNRRILCPHTKNHYIEFSELDCMGNFYRNPIVTRPESLSKRVPIRILEASEIIQLLIEDDPPDSIPLLEVEGEHLDNDLTKVAKGYLGLAVLGAIGLGIVAFYESLTKLDKPKDL